MSRAAWKLSGKDWLHDGRSAAGMPPAAAQCREASPTFAHPQAAAKANGRSLQAEVHDVLRRASTRNLAETRRLSARWLKRLSRSGHSDSAELIHEDRDGR